MKYNHTVKPYTYVEDINVDEARLSVIKKMRESRNQLSDDDPQCKELDQILYLLTDPSKDDQVLYRYYSMMNNVFVYKGKVYEPTPKVEPETVPFLDTSMSLITIDKQRIESFMNVEGIDLIHVYESE